MRGLSSQVAPFVRLMLHDLRLAWRGFLDMFAFLGHPRRTAIVAVSGMVGLHLMAWPVAGLALQHLGHSTEPDMLSSGLLTILAAVFFWMTAQSMLAITRTIHGRSDLDLLLGSPLSARAVLGARLSAIAVGSFGSIGLLVLPVADVAAMMGQPRGLLAYLLLAWLSLAGTTTGLLVALAIFRFVGPRRARMAANLAATLIAGSFVLGAQVWILLPTGWRSSIIAALSATSITDASQLLTPIGTAPWTTAFVSSVVVLAFFFITVWLAADPFARAALSGAGAGSSDFRGSTKEGPLRFASGFGRNVRLKEWRLLRRDPSIYGQLGLQIIYTLPIAVVILSTGENRLPVELAVAPAIVVIAAQVCASLAWIAVSAEEAPELLATVPASRAHIEWLKLSSIVAPVLLVVVVPIGGLALISWRAAALTFVLAALASVSTALLNLWHPMPGNRRGMLRRHQQSKIIALVEHVIAVLWAIAMAIVLFTFWLALIPAIAVAGILWLMSPFTLQDLRAALARAIDRTRSGLRTRLPAHSSGTD